MVVEERRGFIGAMGVQRLFCAVVLLMMMMMMVKIDLVSRPTSFPKIGSSKVTRKLARSWQRWDERY